MLRNDTSQFIIEEDWGIEVEWTRKAEIKKGQVESEGMLWRNQLLEERNCRTLRLIIEEANTFCVRVPPPQEGCKKDLHIQWD